MSDSDESNFGALLFGDEANAAAPEYPVETLIVDRMANMKEGTTHGDFTPLYHRFDSLKLPQGAGTGGGGGQADIEGQLKELSGRLAALQPPPLVVHYRNKHHSLWGHRLWNAAKYLSKRMDQRCIDVRGKTVLELGAGLGVPSLVAYRNGAKVVVVTDYPDTDLLDVIQMNVDENCKPELIDADVSEERDGSSTKKKGTDADAAAVVAVAPLLWGKTEHIDHVMGYTRNTGFDIVILSDILFNHVCNDDLVDTLLRTLSHAPAAAGYCVFSHHRAYKQLQDFEFFDKCVAHGLAYEQVDEQTYPMMFPEDRGPEEVRMPVKYYKITRRHDRVGAPLDLASLFANYAKIAETNENSNYHLLRKAAAAAADNEKTLPHFDAVIQGTGIVQSLLSAALARSGLKVLHCDGEATYGGANATLPLAKFIAYLEDMRTGPETPQAAIQAGEAHLYTRPRVPGTDKPRILLHDEAKLGSNGYFIDLVPASYMAKGAVVEQLVQADMARSMEFLYLNGFFFLQPRDPAHPTRGHTLVPVPLTRADIFSTNAVGLLEKRRLMTFVKDVEASLAEQLHAKFASPADSAELQKQAADAAAAQATRTFAKVLQGNPDLTLSELLAKKYSLSGRALDIMTLMGQLDHRSKSRSPQADEQAGEQRRDPSAAAAAASGAGLLQSVQLVRELLTSVGAFGNEVPFLIPRYGASELPQHACRTAAVWGAVFVLNRGLARVVVDEDTEQQYAVLANGQHIPTRVIVAPEELVREFPSSSSSSSPPGVAKKRVLPVRFAGWRNVLELERRRADGTMNEGLTEADYDAFLRTEAGDARLSRVVVIATRPLISRADMAAGKGSGGAPPREAQGLEGEQPQPPMPPVFIALTRSGTSTDAAVVHLVQQTSITDQVTPYDSQHSILHFTADAAELPQEALEKFVLDNFLSSPTAAAPSTDGKATVIGLHRDSEVAFLASFTLSGLQLAVNSIYGSGSDSDGSQPLLADIPSATRDSHAFAIGECEKLQQATEKDRRRVLHEGDAAAPAGTDADAEGAGAEAKAPPPFLRLVGVPTLPLGAGGSLLNDGQSMRAARQAYEAVVSSITDGMSGPDAATWKKRFVFFERQPPAPQSAGAQ